MTIAYDRRSHEGSLLIARAELAEKRADAAFRKWLLGKSQSSAAAVRLQRVADEAWADVRTQVKYGPELEAGMSEAQINDIERAREGIAVFSNGGYPR